MRALSAKVDGVANNAASGDALSALESRIDTLATALNASTEAGHAVPRELEKLLARHDRGSGAKPVLELNMRHPIVRALARAKAGGHEGDLKELALLLFDQAQILDGEVPDDPAAFAKRLNDFVVRGLATG